MNLILNFKQGRPTKGGIFLVAIKTSTNDGEMCVVEVFPGFELKDDWEGFEQLDDNELYLFRGDGTYKIVGETAELLRNCEISWHAEIPIFDYLDDFYSENDDEAFDFGSYIERLSRPLNGGKRDFSGIFESSFVKITRQ